MPYPSSLKGTKTLWSAAALLPLFPRRVPNSCYQVRPSKPERPRAVSGEGET